MSSCYRATEALNQRCTAAARVLNMIYGLSRLLQTERHVPTDLHSLISRLAGLLLQ